MDASNRWEACNRQSHWRNWKDFAKPEDKEIVDQIAWKSKEDANLILIPYLEKKYKEYKSDIDAKIILANSGLQSQKDQIFLCMEKLTKHPVEYEEIIFWVTTFPRCPYNWEKWYIRLYINSEFPRYWTRTLTHEVLHFQFHKYYSNHPRVKLLSKEQFEIIKESLTFLLNYEFPGVDMTEDKGYPIHQEFRKMLEKYWLELTDKDFDKLVDHGCDLLLQK